MSTPRLYSGKDPVTSPNARLAIERLEREILVLLDRCPRRGVESNILSNDFQRDFRKMRKLWE